MKEKILQIQSVLKIQNNSQFLILDKYIISIITSPLFGEQIQFYNRIN